ncbi:MAG TPA: cation-translocating P-type ATPase [Ruminiclostridium sp.]|nr:cation-translocating P-type ATPase [Ruminiclostridium sp.]
MTEQLKKPYSGLSSSEAAELQKHFGKNMLVPEKKQNLAGKLFDVLKEPMFLLLLFAAVIYFVLGEPRNGAIMLIFVVGIISIETIQERKTDNTLKALKNLSEPRCTVIRDGIEKEIGSADLVPGDLLLISEGLKIPADGFIIKANDFCVDESTLTGEPEGVWKTDFPDIDKAKNSGIYDKRLNYCRAGTLVMQGSAEILIDKIGADTEFGKIGQHVSKAPAEPTPLKKQTSRVVKLCAVIAAVLFLLVMVITWVNLTDHSPGNRLIESILSGITLAMAMIPEEFPVVLTVFLSMGAWRLAKKNSLVRKLPAVETLGAVSVLCVDKTGTITMNNMEVIETFTLNGSEKELCETIGRACESNAYDPMEKAMLGYCEKVGILSDNLFDGELIQEYSFTNSAKMMGHVWRRPGGTVIVTAKGSPEKIAALSGLAENESARVKNKQMEMSKKGLRVIAVGSMKIKDGESIPESLTQCRLKLCGLVGLADPPRKAVKTDILRCIKAGIRVVMITGDNGVTASAIAKQVGMTNSDVSVTGDEISSMSDEELCRRVRTVNIFSRVVPEQKMRIIKAFKENGEIVAMTGDGVNDAPALKYADIGISMGKRGSEVSREASDLILLDDNFSTIVDTVKDGRRIYDNIRKAFGYVLTIHIPVAASSLAAPLLHINPSFLMLLPVHVVLLELLIDPTCSIVFERQPAEPDIMERAPRNPKEKLIDAKLFIKSILQGTILFAASFLTYLYFQNGTENGALLARAMGLSVIIFSNLLLVAVNCSGRNFAVQSFRRLMKDNVMCFIFALTIVGLLVIIYTPAAGFLKLCSLSVIQLFTAFIISFAAVMWFDVIKLIKRFINKN